MLFHNCQGKGERDLTIWLWCWKDLRFFLLFWNKINLFVRGRLCCWKGPGSHLPGCSGSLGHPSFISAGPASPPQLEVEILEHELGFQSEKLPQKLGQVKRVSSQRHHILNPHNKASRALLEPWLSTRFNACCALSSHQTHYCSHSGFVAFENDLNEFDVPERGTWKINWCGLMTAFSTFLL